MTVRHVLLDADGVLQHVPGGWYAAMEPYVGSQAREFLHDTWRRELPYLTGEGGDYLPFLADALALYGVDEPADVVYRDVWHRIEVVDESVALVEALRSAGYGVHLGTNQERERGEHMRDALGYDALFDVSCYSYALGVAKPDLGFFVGAARRIGAAPAEILFVDDTPANVEAARAAGMPAIRWCLDDGHAVLHEALANQGVRLDA
ncbi:putative hydrolase of the HAD superfamily [Cellulosimicrobium cellulans]|jgi:putative hydrolase of the HAD superfamily|uniref:HAD family hydrolase n=1 Tax=Cellulosimicrobium cellulans TaxID=1710 RepID=UPI0019582E87|nr:HAD-IA family hydrolase [Cellulosimicrobium cellulans]MBM7819631.1 putative hydrolase of the HAD superfamily [Cellulosimicrobium cellulans]